MKEILGDHRGGGQGCIRGRAKLKSSAAVVHTTSGLKMPARSEQGLPCTAATSGFSPVHPGRSSGCRLRTRWRSAAAISDVETQQRTSTRRHLVTVENWKWNFHRVSPLTSASGFQNPCLRGPNTASLHTGASPKSGGKGSYSQMVMSSINRLFWLRSRVPASHVSGFMPFFCLMWK